MKTQSNQYLSSFDILHILVAVIFLFILIVPILHADQMAKKREISKIEAKKIADTLITKLHYASDKSRSSSRSLASLLDRSEGLQILEGVKGKDPWGQSYRYKVLRDAYGKPVQLLVWSLGPNNISDTPEEGIVWMADSKPVFLGDDIAYLYPVNQL